MAQARAKTPVAPKKAKAPATPVECALCGQEIVVSEDGEPVEFQGKLYHGDDCLNTAKRKANQAISGGKKRVVAVVDEDEEEADAEAEEAEAEEEDEEAEEDEEDEEDEEAEEDEEEDEEVTAELDEEEADDEEEDDDEEDEEDEDEDEEEEEDEPAPVRRRAATPVAPVAKTTPAERMAAARAAKAAKKTAAVEEYDEEDEPAPKKAAVAKAGGTAKAPAKPKVDVKLPAGIELKFTDNPARAGTKRWAMLEVMARVTRDDMGRAGKGTVENLHKAATRLLQQVSKANPGLFADPEKDTNTKSLNVAWFGTDKGKADIFKNGASGWMIIHEDEADTYRIAKRATKK